jgi:hypothetical protein
MLDETLVTSPSTRPESQSCRQFPTPVTHAPPPPKPRKSALTRLRPFRDDNSTACNK